MPREITNNLPHLPKFIDTKQQVRKLTKAIIDSQRHNILIKGPAGMGKTSLALEVAANIASKDVHPFDFIYYATAKAARWTKLSEIIHPLARFLHNEAIPAAKNRDEKIRLFREELGSRRALLILDNIEDSDVEIIDDINSLSDHLYLLYTSRKYLDTQIRPYKYDIKPLSDKDICRLICLEAGRKDKDNKDIFDSNLLSLIKGNPLAARWVGSRIQNGIPISSLESRLLEGEGDLFSKLFQDNWHDISENARRILMTISLVGPTISYGLLARSSPDSLRDAEDAIAELHQRSLLDIDRPGTDDARVSVHPLVRSYASMRYDALETNEQHTIREEVVSTFINFCEERNYLQLGRNAYDAIDEEIESLLGQLSWMLAQNDQHNQSKIVRYVEALSVYLWRRGRWEERVRFCEAAASAAAAGLDSLRAARNLAAAGIVRHWQGATEEAKQFAVSAESKIDSVSTRPVDKAIVTRLNALIAHAENRSGDALNKMLMVLDAVREADPTDERNQNAIRIFSDWPCAGKMGFRSGEVALLQEIGIIYTDLNQKEDAEYWLGRSIEIAEQINDDEGKAIALSHRGRAAEQTEPSKASIDFQSALQLAKKVGRRSTEGRALLGLSSTISSGRDIRLDYARQARTIFAQLGMSKEMTACQDRINMLQLHGTA